MIDSSNAIGPEQCTLPLLPVKIIICPEGFVSLRINDSRYIDFIKTCLRTKSAFVFLMPLMEDEVRFSKDLPDANLGSKVHITDADIDKKGVFTIVCQCSQRVRVLSCNERDDGQLIGVVKSISNDLTFPIPDDLAFASRVLKKLLAPITFFGHPYLGIAVQKPFKFDCASWVSNRWVEILDLPRLRKQRLMELDSPIVRLELIQDVLMKGYIRLN